jgi:transcriptional regulator NrdR family protein
MMRCTRCGAQTDVMESREPAQTSAAKRRAARKVVGDSTTYVIRRRKCRDCAQLYHTVEVAMPYPSEPEP